MDRLRISNAERQTAINVLKEAYADGRITGPELDQRTASALSSTTYGELAVLLDDLSASAALDQPESQPYASSGGCVRSACDGVMHLARALMCCCTRKR